MKVRDILEVKGSQVYSIQPDQTILDAVAILMRHRIGALLVRDATGNQSEAMGYYKKALYLEPNHHASQIHLALLMEKLKLSRDIAERTWSLLADPARGFTPDARFDRRGFGNMLALRAEMEGGRASAAPEKYFDLSYYERALARLSR